MTCTSPVSPPDAPCRNPLRAVRLHLLAAVMLALAFAWGAAGTAFANGGRMSLVRDAEIETALRTIATPLFEAAGLNPNDVDIYLVQNDELNAFVAGGQNLFIHTGLITATDDAGQLAGVVAHETGHIQGGHLVRTRDAHEKAQMQGIIGALLGTAAAIGSGRADVGAAVVMGGQEVGMRSFLKYSRTQESSADHAALRLLDQTGQSSAGTLAFLEKLGAQELVAAERQDPYVRTHPLTRERIDAIRAHLETSSNANKKPSPEIVEMHRRMKAKLNGFIDPPAKTLRAYEKDDSVAGRYARAIALYRKPRTQEAVAAVDALIAQEPGNPYFHELKGQILFESGQVAESVAPHRQSVALAPNAALLRLGLARALIETGGTKNLEEAADHLRVVLRQDRPTAFVWRQLAIAEGRLGDTGSSTLALAEEARLLGDRAKAKHFAARAKDLLPAGSPGGLRARDILNDLDDDGKKDKKPK